MEDTAHGENSGLTGDPVVRVFARAVVDAVASYAATSRQQLETTVRAEAARIASENEALAVDAAGRRWLTLCSLLLASYRTLVPLVGDPPAVLAVLQSAMTRPFTAGITAFLRDRFGISQDAPEEAFERIAETFQSRGEERFGRAFRFVPNGRDDACSFTMDYVWAEELAHPRYRVRFERPTTLAAGGRPKAATLVESQVVKAHAASRDRRRIESRRFP